jgi:16S rRNA G1207 methylase RsmC
MSRSTHTRAAILRALRTLTYAQRQLEALLARAPRGRRLPIPARAHEEVLVFEHILDRGVCALAVELRRSGPTVRAAEARRQAARREAWLDKILRARTHAALHVIDRQLHAARGLDADTRDSLHAFVSTGHSTVSRHCHNPRPPTVLIKTSRGKTFEALSW